MSSFIPVTSDIDVWIWRLPLLWIVQSIALAILEEAWVQSVPNQAKKGPNRETGLSLGFQLAIGAPLEWAWPKHLCRVGFEIGLGAALAYQWMGAGSSSTSDSWLLVPLLPVTATSGHSPMSKSWFEIEAKASCGFTLASLDLPRDAWQSGCSRMFHFSSATGTVWKGATYQFSSLAQAI